MKLSHIPGTIQYSRKKAAYTFLSTGDIYLFTNGSTMVNGFIGSKKDGSANNIWLRIYDDNNKITAYPLLGIASGSQLHQGPEALKYTGEAEGIAYEVIFRPCDSVWFWDIRLSGANKTVDIIYGQDLGMAEKSGLLENELYAAQYLGHTVIEDEYGYHLCSRQNLPQNGCFPYIQQGMLHGKAIGYSTDALQFFGLSYKADNVPSILSGNLENKNLQLESSYTALQSEKLDLKGRRRLTIYCYFQEDHKESVSRIEKKDLILSSYQALKESRDCTALPKVKVRPQFGTPYVSPLWDKSAVERRYPERILEEYEADRLLSFFTPDYSHIVLKQKELVTERPHGNIITTQADTKKVNSSLITSTNYIHGLFHCQTAVGNTSKHKFLSASRGLFDLLKNSGQRIWILLEGTYHLLAVPSLFEAGLNYSRWMYQMEDDILQVTAFAVSDETRIITEVESLNHIPYDFIITNQLVMGTHEFTSPVTVTEEDSVLHFYPEHPESTPYPDWHYDMSIPGTTYTWSDDRIFFEDGEPQNGTLLSVSLSGEARFQIVISGFLEENSAVSGGPADFQRELSSYQEYYTQFLCNFFLAKEGEAQKEIDKLNVISRWYAHNALVHFAVPHGLEQSGGAAWGTRDICQGPFEFLLSVQKLELARDVLLRVFSNQFLSSGEWPQWFMFDRYRDCQEDCHGDVVLWPLKCVCDYILASGDGTILAEPLPFRDAPQSEGLPLSGHIKAAVSSVEKRFLQGTFLISYAGGDWDDTLQPAEEALKSELVSSWTQALAYQVFSLLGDTMASCDTGYARHLKYLAGKIKEAFEQYLIIDGVIAGFVYRLADGSFSPMLHPDDPDTGIHLRLLPLTRSIIADMAPPQLAERNMDFIEAQLHFPDGVRLMDHPAGYHGGVSRLFRRAEQAANIGREISLQYVHAHIRYIEALCHMGLSRQAWHALFEINPICLKDCVPNAAYRQSNLYFSSSDGAFYDRYEYDADFEKLYDASISVKGGWRIYSSGPGIYLGVLIGNILGIRFAGDALILDPVMPRFLDGLRFRYQCFGNDYIFVYHIASDTFPKSIRAVQDGEELPALPLAGPYRTGGIQICQKDLRSNRGEIHIFA